MLTLATAALPVSAVPVSSVPLSTPALWLTGIERWIMLLGLAVALGGLAGRGVGRYYKDRHPGPLAPPWAMRGSLVGLAASLALFVTAIIGPDLARRLAEPPAPGLEKGGTALIAAIEAALFALSALSLWLRQQGLSAMWLCGVGLAEGIRAHPEGIVPVAGALLTYCHLFPAILWAGMLFYTVRAAIAWRGDPEAMQGLVRLYSKVAGWLFALVVITGVISALVLVPLGSLLTTTYGQFLVAKAAVVCLVTGCAIAGQAWLRHRPLPGAGPALATKLEVAGLALVLAITSVLTVLTPPAKPIRGANASAPAAVSVVSPARR
jgi:copper transport protein